jgi:hypothetical protein
MRIRLGRVAALAALVFLNADTGALASAEADCKKCDRNESGSAVCNDVGAGGSGYTGCTPHWDPHHGQHCDFSGEPCVIVA